MLRDNIKVLAEKRGTNFHKIEEKCELSNGSIRRWNTWYPSADKLKKVAVFLDTTMDELMKGCAE